MQEDVTSSTSDKKESHPVIFNRLCGLLIKSVVMSMDEMLAPLGLMQQVGDFCIHASRGPLMIYVPPLQQLPGNSVHALLIQLVCLCLWQED